MTIFLFILFLLLFPLYIIIELFRINFLNNKNNVLLLGLISLIAIGYGLIVVVKFGLIVDYSDADLHQIEQSVFLVGMGWLNIWIGFFSVALSILKFIVFKFKK